MVFLHPGEKDVYEWVKGKWETVTLFGNGTLHTLFPEKNIAVIKAAKKRLLDVYRASVDKSLDRVYGAESEITIGDRFFYEHLLPEVINHREYQ